jgi:hypothetical protein
MLASLFLGGNKECRENFEKFGKFESNCNVWEEEKENECREEEFGFYKLGGPIKGMTPSLSFISSLKIFLPAI